MSQNNSMDEKNQAGQPRKKSAWPSWVLPLLFFVSAAAATTAAAELLLIERIPPWMQGKWLIAEGEEQGKVLEFFRNGSMHIIVPTEKGAETIPGRIEMKGDAFRLTIGDSIPGNMVADTTILDFNDERLVAQDRGGDLFILTRLCEPGKGHRPLASHVSP